MNRSKTLLALALALPTVALATGCGGDDSSGDDPADVLEATFNNDTQLESGVIDLSFDIGAEGDQGGSLNVELSGPFVAGEEPTDVGQVDLDVSVSGEGSLGEALPEDIEAGFTISEDNIYVNYQDTDYEVGTEAFEQLQAQQEAAVESTEGEDAASSFREGCAQAIEAQGGDAAACDFDVTAWFTDLENEGTEDAGGADATHIAGSLDVQQMLTDLVGLGTSVPGATGGVDPALIEPQLQQAAEAVETATFDVYSASEDETLRGLDLALDIDTAAVGAGAVGVDSAAVGFSFEISEVGDEQTIEVPDDPQPIEDLAGELGGLIPGGTGVPPTGLPGGGTELPGGGGTVPGAPDPECIADAAGDPAEIQKCLLE